MTFVSQLQKNIFFTVYPQHQKNCRQAFRSTSGTSSEEPVLDSQFGLAAEQCFMLFPEMKGGPD